MTGPGGGFGVDPDAVRAHAKKVAEVSDRLGNAVSAAGKTTLNTEAFGLIGQFLVPAVMAVEGVVTATIKASQDSAEDMFQSVKQTAASYESDDTQAAGGIQHLQGEIHG